MAYKEIQENLLGLTSLKSVMITYQEIAATRMQRVKDSVLRNRNFLEEIRPIYIELRANYKDALEKTLKSNVANKQRQNKLVTVLLSANTKLYGDILSKTFTLFNNDIQNKETDIIIVGKIGLQLFKESNPDRPYTYYDLSDGLKDIQTLQKFLTTIGSYAAIEVFHGKFENILDQEPTKTVISPEQALTTEVQDEVPISDPSQPITHYLFEPSLETILLFFETEILSSLLEQTVYESDLSKFTSRMTSLDSTVENIDEEIVKAKFRERRYIHKELNRKQRDQLAGIALWH